MPRKSRLDSKEVHTADGARSMKTAKSLRLLALLQVHNDIEYLPGYFENVAPHVDGIVVYDDGSTDGSAEFIRAQSCVLQMTTRSPNDATPWDEAHNHRIVRDTAVRMGADWVIAVDADERVERTFRERAEREIERALGEGWRALSVAIRELWSSPTTYRADGMWGDKQQARLFRLLPDNEYDDRRYHPHWAPLNGKVRGFFKRADAILYHMRMIRSEDRRMRRDKWNELDPHREWQTAGYDHLTDETELILESLPEGREYEPTEMPSPPELVAQLNGFHAPRQKNSR